MSQTKPLRIKEYMEKLHFTQKWMRMKLMEFGYEISETNMSNYYNNRNNPPIYLLKPMAQALDLSVDDII